MVLLSHFKFWHLGIGLSVLAFGVTPVIWSQIANAQAAGTSAPGGGAITIRSDVQEANSKTGVVTARGNVQINYPAKQIQATSAQAQYYSRERRIILTGNVYVLQEGNSMRGEVITYLLDEGRFVALPRSAQQVESIYMVPAASPRPVAAIAAPAEATAPTSPVIPASPLRPLTLPSIAPPSIPTPTPSSN
jgi:lipopolysaccharide export system protein LptA